MKTIIIFVINLLPFIKANSIFHSSEFDETNNIFTWKRDISEFLLNNHYYIFNNVVGRDLHSLNVLKDIIPWLQSKNNDRLLVINDQNLNNRHNIINTFEKFYRLFFNTNIYRIRSETSEKTLHNFRQIAFRRNFKNLNFHGDTFFHDVLDNLAKENTLLIFERANPGNKFLGLLRAYVKEHDKLKVLIGSNEDTWPDYQYRMLNYDNYKHKVRSLKEIARPGSFEEYASSSEEDWTPKSNNVEDFISTFITEPEAKKKRKNGYS